MWEERRGFVKKESQRYIRGWPGNSVEMWKIIQQGEITTLYGC